MTKKNIGYILYSNLKQLWAWTFQIYRASKKTHLKEMCDFFNPKNVTNGSGVDQKQKIAIYFKFQLLISQKIPFLNGKLSLVIQ